MRSTWGGGVMTERHAGYLVVLKKSIREDDAEPTLIALRQIKNVVSVEPVTDNAGLQTIRMRTKRELLDKLYQFCKEISDGI